MRSSLFLIIVLLSSCLILFTTCSEQEAGQGQGDFGNRKSPIAIAKLNHNDTYVKIVYGQPYKNGRNIFGDLVAFDEVWRTGANEATELTTTGSLIIGGEMLAPGTYALFTIPRIETWTLILNSELGQWGAFDYDSSMDVLRVDVPVSNTEQVSEVFTIQFGEVAGDSSSIILKWDDTVVQVPIEFYSPDDSKT